jgi:dTDP-4-dehydrorhamnose reductase
MKIVVLGASGLLGTRLLPALSLAGYHVVTLGRSLGSDHKCDIGNLKNLSGVLDELEPDILINLVALTDVDLCESDPRQAFSVNLLITENIVRWVESSAKACHLIHISTDQVYDGCGPHSEQNVQLSNYYGFSKYAAELAVLRINSTILRTNFFGKSICDGRASFSDWIYNSAVNQSKISVFNDVYFSPLSMGTLVEMVMLVVSNRPIGIFNLGSRGGLSKSEFALSFLNLLKLNIDNIDIVSIDDVSFIKTYRPKDMRLNVTKFEHQLAIQLPSLHTEIQEIIGDYSE